MSFKYIDLNDNYISSFSGGNQNEIQDQTNIYLFLKQPKLDNQLVAKNKFILKSHQEKIIHFIIAPGICYDSNGANLGR